MFMSEQEIVTRYRQAKSKTQQIRILAEINLCEPADIIELLTLNGEYHKSNYNTKRWSEAECMRLEQMLDNRMKMSEIAAVYGCKQGVMSSTVTYLRSRGKLRRREYNRGHRPSTLRSA